MRRKLLIAGFLASLTPSAYLAWTARDMPHLGHYHDDGIYWVTARSLASGSGYRILSMPEQPYQTKYPPLYPLLLAGVWKVNPSFPENLTLAIWLCWLPVPLFLLLAYGTLGDLGLDRTARAVLCAILAFNPTLAFLGVNVMADVWFVCLLLLSLALVVRAGEGSATSWWSVAAGLAAGAAYLTRAVALPLLGAAPVWLLIRRKPRCAVLFAAAMLPAVVGWDLWTSAHFPTASDFASLYYTNYAAAQRHNFGWSDLPLLISNNSYFLLTAISRLLVFNTGESFWSGFFWRCFVFACFAGVARLTRSKGLGPYPLFALGFLPMLLVWGWPPDDRHLLPIFPLLLAGLWTELDHIVGMLRATFQKSEAAPRVVAGAFLAGLAAFGCLFLYRNGDALFRFLPGLIAQHRQLNADKRSAYAWVAANTPKDTTFFAYDDPVFWTYTGRRALGLPIPPKVFYKEGPEGVSRLFQSLPEYLHERRLQAVFSTAGDFYRGDVSEDRRKLVRGLWDDARFQLLYRSGLVAIHRAKDGGPEHGLSQAHYLK